MSRTFTLRRTEDEVYNGTILYADVKLILYQTTAGYIKNIINILRKPFTMLLNFTKFRIDSFLLCT